MKNELKDIFTSMPTIDGDVAAQFIGLLELPDDQFDQIYPIFRSEIAKVYEGEEFQKNLLNQLKITPIEDVEEEEQVVRDFLNEIYKDDSLSDNKKEMISIMFNSTLEIFERLVKTGRQSVKVKVVKLEPDAILPQYAHPTDAGADVYAIETITIEPHATNIVKTGIAMAIPAGYEVQIRPRSGLSISTNLRIPNAPGTIDTDYRGEIGVPMSNIGDTPITIEKGSKVAQMLIAPTPMINWDEVATVEELGETARGAGGFGSTDKS